MTQCSSVTEGQCAEALLSLLELYSERVLWSTAGCNTQPIWARDESPLTNERRDHDRNTKAARQSMTGVLILLSSNKPSAIFHHFLYIYIWPSRRSICTDYSAQLILVFNRHPPMVSVSSWFYAWYPQISVSCVWCANGYMLKIYRFTRVTVCSILVIILVKCLFCRFYCDLMCGLKTWFFWLGSLALL